MIQNARLRALAVVGACLAASFGLASAARAEPCAPVHVVAPAPLPDAWQRAADALVDATATTGRPWSCPDTEIVIVVDADGGGAVLRIATPRGPRERRVVTPDDLVSTGKAWLSVLPRPEPPPPKVERPAAEVREPERPRAQIGAAVGARFEGPTDVLVTAAELRIAAPFGPWSIGAWFRFGVAAAAFDRVPAGFNMNESVLGALVERRIDVGAYSLRGAFLPAFAAVAMESGPEKTEVSGEKVDVRVGLGIGVARRLGSSWRVTLDAETELAPLALRGGPSRHIDPGLPAVPGWGVGGELGIEAWLH